MSGIYDFEGYRTPYLNVEMLMERKEKKRRKQMLILSCIVAVLMAATAVVTLVTTSYVSQEFFIAAIIGFGVYMIAGAICVGAFLKKREEITWELV